MTESQFIEKNREKWHELESLLVANNRDADKLHELFIKVSSDLSYARTFYPNRSVRLYLNNLTQRVFDSMSSTGSKFGFSTVLKFFKRTLPREVIRSRNAFVVSFSIFILSAIIGALSTSHNEDFARLILGDHYIHVTDENINKGDPMAIYKDEDKVDMLLGITLNNIKVAFIAFALGLLGTMGTVFILMFNGIMLGTFQYYFYSKGLFMTSFLTIWIHGTIEISAIIIAGAAGIVLGSGLLFPGTYDRILSLQVSAKRALVIVLGTVPLFVIAGILESFVTRQTDLPVAVKAGIILLSLLLIIFMWIVLPWRLRATKNEKDDPINLAPEHYSELDYQRLQYRTIGENFTLAFAQIRASFGPYLKSIVVPAAVVLAILNWYHIETIDLDVFEFSETDISLFEFKHGGVTNFLFIWICLTLSLLALSRFEKTRSTGLTLSFTRSYFLPVAIITLIYVTVFYFLPTPAWIIILLILSPQLLAIATNQITMDKIQSWSGFVSSYRFSITYYMNFIPPIILTALFLWITYILFDSGLSMIITEYFSWHEIFDYQFLNQLYIEHVYYFSATMFILPLAYFILTNTYHSELCRTEALDLRQRFQTFGANSSILEKE